MKKTVLAIFTFFALVTGARAQEAQGALQMMEFEGKDLVEQYVQQGQTLLNVVQQMSARMDQMAAALGMAPAAPAAAPAAAARPSETGTSGGMADRMTQESMEAQAPQTGYMQNIVKRSKPEVPGV